MELQFIKNSQNLYEAVFEVTADFNIHIERKDNSSLVIQQSGIADGQFDTAINFGLDARKVIDYDCAALVYPKYIKVVSGSEVIKGEVTFGE